MRNATHTLTGDDRDRSNFYAECVIGVIGTGSTVLFTYEARTGGVTEREVQPLELVGEPGLSTYGFKGLTDNGVRTFNFHLMGA